VAALGAAREHYLERFLAAIPIIRPRLKWRCGPTSPTRIVPGLAEGRPNEIRTNLDTKEDRLVLCTIGTEGRKKQ